MTYKEKVDWLGRYQRAVQEQAFLQQEILRLRCEAEKLSGALGAAPGGARRTDGVPAAVEHIVAAQKKIEQQLETCLERRLEVTEAISRVPDAARREVLRLRYLEGRGYAAIADEIGLVERQVYRLHRRGVEEVETPSQQTEKTCQ